MMGDVKCSCEPRDIVDYSRCLSGECGGTKTKSAPTKSVGGTLETLLTLIQYQGEQIVGLRQKLDRVRKALEDNND
jgi:hypothetical protein